MRIKIILIWAVFIAHEKVLVQGLSPHQRLRHGHDYGGLGSETTKKKNIVAGSYEARLDIHSLLSGDNGHGDHSWVEEGAQWE
eukprot:13511117-Ditylum_brightwellii.AAC.1